MRPGTGREAMLTARPGALDSSSIIDLLDKRMNELEGRLKDGTSGPVGNHSHSINKHHMSHRDETEHDWSRRKGLALGDMEYALQEMQLQLNAQSNMLESLSSRYEDFSSSRRLAATASDDSAHSLKDLKKRVKTVTNEVEDLARSNKEFSGHLRELVDQINGMTVRYVQNSADFSSVEKFKWQVGDWEAAIMEAASLFVDSDNTEYSWNRYLDNHIGIYVPNASGDCEGYYDQIESTITENGDFDYGLRVTSSFGEGTHYYTATAGIRSWEFNAQYCVKDDETDICGCLADNSYVDYYSQYEKTCLKSQE
jgi:hypothetical protein